MIENIPSELRVLPQWVVAGNDKAPINPRTGHAASPTDPLTWATFEEARTAGYPHIGFVLHNDPFTIIDLDDPFQRKDKSFILEGDDDYGSAVEMAERHKKIFEAFTGYAELSQSGRGVHIIVRGTIPSGVRRDKVEVYSDERYMICTGNVIRNAPILEHQELLNMVHQQMASTIVDANYVDEDQKLTDDQLLTMASEAVNGGKFNALCSGDISGYPSQSEADFALLTILSFYSKNDEQVRRLFRYTPLGQRDKAQRNDDYLNRALQKIRAKQAVPKIDLSSFLGRALAPPPPPPPMIYTMPSEPDPIDHLVELPKSPLVFPPGLVGMIADYMYSSAIRPVPEIALAGALGLTSGILGRSYNISGAGLNQYLVLLAKTGTGKESLSGGMEALVASVRQHIPGADDVFGPAAFASGQALIRVLDKKPCFVSLLGEFGLTLQQICSRNAGSHEIMLRKVLLDLFAKSGHTNMLRASVYSDQEKNTQPVRAPNVTILGESTPEKFYGALDSSHIAEGLVPRFTVIEYSGDRPPKNPNAFHRPHPNLTSHLRSAFEIAMQTRANETCCQVITDPSALIMLDDFDRLADDKINSAQAEVESQIWNRAHIKALKLASLLAVGCNLYQPIITKDLAQWAIDTVTNDVNLMTTKFNSGQIGEGDHQQEHAIREAVKRYHDLTQTQKTQYKVPRLLLDKPQLVPYVYLKRYLIQRAAFKNDRRGAVMALQVALTDFIKSGMLKQIPAEQARTELGVDSPVYVKGESW